MNRAVVGQASRLPPGRLAPGFVAGETPAKTAGTAAPLESGFFMASTPTPISTGLQPGENVRLKSRSRFNGFGAGWQAVETVRSAFAPYSTGLKLLKPRC